MGVFGYVVRICFHYINISISIGLMFGLMILLRPVLKRALAPQQRVVLWSVGWFSAYAASWYSLLGWLNVLPETFRSLTTPRISYGNSYSVPAFLPDYYAQPGTYNVALPGGLAVEVEFTKWLAWGIALLWLVGLIAALVLFSRREKAVKEMMRAGTPVPLSADWLTDPQELRERGVEVRICENIPTSFVSRLRADSDAGIDVRHTICLQKELPTEQMTLVLRHELSHIRLWHCYFKFLSTTALTIHWFNPLLWLGNKYFCQDLELACDRATLKQLPPGKRKEYAKTLLELAVGEQMWDTPVCFGESDAQLRIKEIAAWKLPETIKERGVILGQIAVFVLLFLFFVGGPSTRTLPQDVLLLWQQQGGTPQSLLQKVEDVVQDNFPMETKTVDSPVWIVDAEDWLGDNFWLYVQMTDGNWWRLYGDIFSRKSVTQVRIIDSDLLAEAPDLTGAARLM